MAMKNHAFWYYVTSSTLNKPNILIGSQNIVEDLPFPPLILRMNSCTSVLQGKILCHSLAAKHPYHTMVQKPWIPKVEKSVSKYRLTNWTIPATTSPKHVPIQCIKNTMSFSTISNHELSPMKVYTRERLKTSTNGHNSNIFYHCNGSLVYNMHAFEVHQPIRGMLSQHRASKFPIILTKITPEYN